ncbi:MAG TPA: LuxR C-terminal-related transcriptional regulator [Gemmatimonadales bacterium]|nr:LuxR C-terminal-related transcriptional regulator [Gemmatimonadales bacterium]
MSTEPDQRAGAAWAAVAAGDWPAARTAFEALVDVEPSPEALAGLGDVLWWLGDTSAAIGHQERAYAGFRHRGDPADAATVAVGLYLLYRNSVGSTVVARGWLERASRLVDEAGLEPLAGWVALLRAHDSADPGAAERWATEAHEAAGRFGDPDLELCALSQLGAALVQQGRTAEGVRLLDESMAAALAGEARRPHTVVYTSCNLVRSCAECAEYEHALEWIRAADAFEHRIANTHFYTTCRTYLGAIQFAAGDWPAAEQELRAALDPSAEPDLAGEAAARLAELRLAQGRLNEAERLLDGLADQPACARVLAWLALARGDAADARRRARRLANGLAAEEQTRAARYRPGLSGPLAEAAVWEVLAAACEGAEADAAVTHLEALAESTRSEQLQARALGAAGRVRGDVPSLERALGLFIRLRLPLAAARIRLVLAELLSGDDAIAEARAALVTFEGLGAARDADAAAARLRALGVTAARGGRAGVGELTQREREVLDLLGEGLTNKELAERLFLSRKTVERHVRNVLFKLGLRNRAEAAAYVVRHSQEIRSTN